MNKNPHPTIDFEAQEAKRNILAYQFSKTNGPRLVVKIERGQNKKTNRQSFFQ